MCVRMKNMKFDFAKLIAANILCLKWADHFKKGKKKYHIFVNELRNNATPYMELLSPTKKKEFEKDLKVMFYAAEIENELITQFIPIIFYVCRRFNIFKPERVQEIYDQGLVSLRHSVWRYSKDVCTFKTFASNGLLGYIGGYLSHEKNAKTFKKNQIYINIKPLNLENKNSQDFDCHPISKFESAETLLERKEDEITFDYLARKANLTEEEIVLLTIYMERDYVPENFTWRKIYMKKYKTKFGKAICKTTVSQKVNVIKKRLLQAVISLKGEEFSKQYSLVG